MKEKSLRNQGETPEECTGCTAIMASGRQKSGAQLQPDKRVVIHQSRHGTEGHNRNVAVQRAKV